MASIGTYDETAIAGAVELEVTDIATGATSYTAYDGDGETLATGAVSGDSVTIPAPDGSWPPGWTLILFHRDVWGGSTGDVIDALQVTVLRDDSPLPSPPAVGTSPNAGDPNDRLNDEYLHGFTAMGPQRWQISDAANPTVLAVGPNTGGTIAHIQANLALDAGAAGYTNPAYADAARPRPQFVQFPEQHITDTPGYADGVEETVDALGPGTASAVEWFEGLNEPQGQEGLTALQTAAQFDVFRAAVKAGHPDAKAMGPCEVAYAPTGSDFSPGVGQLAIFLAAIEPGTLDGLSLHDYNGFNGDFIAFDGWLQALRDALEDAGYPDDHPIWLTENSVGPAWFSFCPSFMLNWAVVLYLTAERHGIPKEQIAWFFDTNYGNPFPNWIKEQIGDLRPVATFLRVLSEEVFGKAYNAPLDFGEIGNAFYRGNVYRGAEGACIAVYAQGNPDDTVTLTVSDTGTLTYSDWQGKTATAEVIAGRVTLPIRHTPIYLRLSAACTVSVFDVGDGLRGDVVNIGPDATATNTSGASNVGRVNDGVMQTGGYLAGPDYVYASHGVPETITLTWDEPQTIGKVLIRQTSPWTNYNGSSAMTKGRIEYWNGSGWLPCPTVARAHWDGRGRYNNTTTDSFLSYVGGAPYELTWYDQNWCHNVDLAVPITTTKLRWTVTEVTYGDVPNKDAAAFAPSGFIDFENTQPRLMVSEIVVVEGSIPASGLAVLA